MGDGENRRPVRVERGEPIGAAGGHGGKRLAVRRGGAGQTLLPSLHRLAAEVRPAATLPVAKMQLLQPRIEDDIRAEPFGKIPRAPGRARHDAAALRQPSEADGGSVERFGNAFEVEPAVAQPSLAEGLGVPHQDQTHAASASRNEIS